MVKYNFGSGNDIKNGYINLDKEDCDLNKHPLRINWEKIKSESTEECLLYHVIEHTICDRLDLMMEIRRILKIGGIARIKLPLLAPKLGHASCFHTKYYFALIISAKFKKVVNKQTGDYFEQIEYKKIFKGFSFRFPYILIDNYYVLKRLR